MIPDEAVNRFYIISELLPALGEAVRDLLGGPHVAVDAAVLQQLQHSEVDVAVARHHLYVFAASSRLDDVAVQKTFNGLGKI